MYAIEYTKHAVKSLKTMPSNVAKTIRDKINVLAIDPYAARNVKKLEARDGYRLRVGDWRVLYEINEGKLIVVVLAVCPRGGAYR
ncbi:type II toxin-antitoxin system RelE family toxin [Pararobbsia silviterrae]|uniref:Type II toxin-antitoxin system RelE/ParE family toxin n=1 Tax=Pararobbsia silviterrae TaxID=1792498 RepID=A0A494Y4K9_9BURK|nr:type II toxin-antitoxin system RelE/ParE family toxin [Pararobbsia silviterrae]RKP57656.1 type II toxin-antitoxin system RelE/ParE family toxin [Pararobbsia silviterrae]